MGCIALFQFFIMQEGSEVTILKTSLLVEMHIKRWYMACKMHVGLHNLEPLWSSVDFILSTDEVHFLDDISDSDDEEAVV